MLYHRLEAGPRQPRAWAPPLRASRGQALATRREVAWESQRRLPGVTEAGAGCFNTHSFDAMVLVRRRGAFCGVSIDFSSYVHELSHSTLSAASKEKLPSAFRKLRSERVSDRPKVTQLQSSS